MLNLQTKKRRRSQRGKAEKRSEKQVRVVACLSTWYAAQRSGERESEIVWGTHTHTHGLFYGFSKHALTHTHADKQFNYRCWLSRDDIFNFIAGLLLSSVKPAWNDSQPDENCLRSVYAHIKVYFIHDINLCDVYSRIIWRFMKGTSLSHVICESITIINFYSLI